MSYVLIKAVLFIFAAVITLAVIVSLSDEGKELSWVRDIPPRKRRG